MAAHSARSSNRQRRALLLGGGLTSVLAAGLAIRLSGALLVPTLIVLLAGIDLAGAIAAKSWADSPGPWIFVVGAASYVLLFWIYGQSLRHGELSTVTVGWVVLLTVGTMILDRFHYGVSFPTSKWVAAVVVVVLLGYLLVDSAPVNTDSSRAAEPTPASSTGTGK